jgi:hypothetical protein
MKKNREWLNDIRPWSMVLVLQIPSLRAIFKYSPYPVVSAILMILVSYLFYLLLFQSSSVRKAACEQLSSYTVTFILVIIFIMINFFVYPYADALKYSGHGSTADDALIEPAQALLSGENLYDAQLPDKVPISPGPGWILMNIIFTGTGLYFLMTPFYVGLSAIVFMTAGGEKAGSNLVLLCLCSALIFWELMVTGHDVVAIGCMSVTLLVLVERFSQKREGSKTILLFIGFALVLGALATSRILFIILPPLFGIILWKRDRALGISLALGSLFTALLLHAVFYVRSEFYQPLHLFDRAESNMGLVLIILGAITSAIVVIAAIIKVKNNLDSWLLWFSLLIATPLIFISLGELRNVGYDFARWEGANYIMPAAPSVLFSLFINYSQDNGKP